MSTSVLATPRFHCPFIVHTDASKYAVGASLAQLDDEGREKSIAYASSRLSAVQSRWSVIEKESYAKVFALSKFDSIVFNSQDLFVQRSQSPASHSNR